VGVKVGVSIDRYWWSHTFGRFVDVRVDMSPDDTSLIPLLQLLKFPRSQRWYGQTDMARSTRLAILIKHMYNVLGRKRFFHPVT